MLLPPQEKKQFLDQLCRPGVSSLMRKGLKKKIVEKCKKISHCPYCEALNGNCQIIVMSVLYSGVLLFWRSHCGGGGGGVSGYSVSL